MKLQPTSNNGQESRQKSRFFPLTLKGLLWILILILGLLSSLFLSITSLAIWLLTRNLFYLFTSVVGGSLFIILGYVNLKEQPTSRL